MRNGITPAEYIKTNCENAFRIKESEIIRDLTKQSGIIISTGGGAPVYSPNEYYLKQNSIVFFIKRNLSDLSRSDRPLSSIVSPEEMASKRYPVYERLADHSVDFTSSDETASVIAEIYNTMVNKGN